MSNQPIFADYASQVRAGLPRAPKGDPFRIAEAGVSTALSPNQQCQQPGIDTRYWGIGGSDPSENI